MTEVGRTQRGNRPRVQQRNRLDKAPNSMQTEIVNGTGEAQLGKTISTVPLFDQLIDSSPHKVQLTQYSDLTVLDKVTSNKTGHTQVLQEITQPLSKETE